MLWHRLLKFNWQRQNDQPNKKVCFTALITCFATFDRFLTVRILLLSLMFVFVRTLPANGQCEYFCVCLSILCGWATGLIFLSELCVYTVTRLLLSRRQISRAEFTDKTALSYKQCYMKRFHKSCMTFQSLLPCHFSRWHFWWDGKTLTCTVWLKGLALSLIQNISLSPFTTADELKTKSKLKTPFTINLLMDGRRFVRRNMRRFHYDWKRR